MKNILNFAFYFILSSLVLFSCTKDTGGEVIKSDMTFTFEEIEVGDIYVDMKVTPSMDDVSYYASAISLETFNSYEDLTALETSIIADLQYQVSQGTAIEDLLSTGEDDIKVEGLDFETSYIFFAVGIKSSDVTANSEISTQAFSTGANTIIFTVNINEPTSNSIEAEVIPTDIEMTYTVGIIDKAYFDSFESDQAYIEDYIAYLKDAYGSIAPTLSKGITYWEADSLDPETEYYVMVYGLNIDETITTEVIKMTFTTKSIEMADMSFNVTNTIEHNVIDYAIAPSSQENYYFHCFVSDMELADFSLEEMFKLKWEEDYMPNTMPGLGYTKEEIMKASAKIGNFSDKKPLMSNQKWHLLVGGVNNVLQINTEISSIEFTTGEAHLDYTASISVEKITNTSASIELTLSGPMHYYYKVRTKEFVDQYSTDDELKDAISLETEDNIDRSFDTNPTHNTTGLDSNTDYCVLVFGYNEGLATEPYKHYFKTLEDGDASLATFNINIKPFFGSAELELIPSGDDFIYAHGYVAVEVYNTALTNNDNDVTEAVKEIFDAEVIEQMDWYNWTREKVINDVLGKVGNYNTTINWLDTETDYVYWTIALSSVELLPVSAGVVNEFATRKLEPSDASVTISNIKYFQMAELREAYPDNSWYEGNLAVVTYEVTGGATAYKMYTSYYYSWSGELNNQNVFSALYPHNETKKHATTNVQDWGSTQLYAAIAMDEKGNYGNFTSIEVTPVMGEDSDPSEFPADLLVGGTSSATSTSKDRVAQIRNNANRKSATSNKTDLKQLNNSVEMPKIKIAEKQFIIIPTRINK